MKFIQGHSRTQTHLFPISLEESIDSDNDVRVIDLFVDSLDLGALGFTMVFSENGRPAYHPGDLLKLYLYGYMNRIRSSRQLEKECKRNIEVMWLLHSLAPDHNTISNFRRDNPKAIKRVFRATVRMAQNYNLIGGTLVAGDSTKLRAQNSKKNNYNQKKIDRHLAYIEGKLAEHEQALAANDGDVTFHQREIAKHEQRKANYKQLEDDLKDSGEAQISTTDPDSRHQITRNNITEVCYTAQTTVDAKHYIPIDYKLTNQNDKKAMGIMLTRAKTILRTTNFTALYDKGYHTGSELAIADYLGIHTLVAIPAISRASEAPTAEYNVEHFIYHPASDTYSCPQGQILTTKGNWLSAKNNHGGVSYRFKNYTTKSCKSCPVRPLCTKSAVNGKQVRRSEYTTHIENNKQRIAQSDKLYQRRQAIVEHPYGTIKRQWGFNYIITKKKIERASADVGLILTVYNLKRILKIIGSDAFKIKLIEQVIVFFYIFASLNVIRLNITASHFQHIIPKKYKIEA